MSLFSIQSLFHLGVGVLRAFCEVSIQREREREKEKERDDRTRAEWKLVRCGQLVV